MDQEDVYKPRPEDYTVIYDHFEPACFLTARACFISRSATAAACSIPKASSTRGQIHRMYDDGRPAVDNPYNSMESTAFSQPSAPAGLAMPRHGLRQGRNLGSRAWAYGQGQLNIVKAGANCGWPQPLKESTGTGPYRRPTNPCRAWKSPFTTGFPARRWGHRTTSPLPQWKNDLQWAFKHQQIIRIKLDGHKVVKEEVILRESGRVREMKTGPDGALYVLIDRRGMILRLTPKK